MVRTVSLAALLCFACATADACDAMRPCLPDGASLFDTHGATKARRRVTPGLHRVMSEGAGRAAGVVRSMSGATARVAYRATDAFQCLVSALDQQGYPIKFMGGLRAHGSVRASLHPAGLALDINQYSRNVTRPRMPHNEIALANACGLISGSQWTSRDSGHFQLGGWSGDGRRYASGRHRYASARHRL